MNHRRPPVSGYRPRTRQRPARFAAGRCVLPSCGRPFVIDRELRPWSRARTCSESCRARLGNRGRTAQTCEHCAVVESWRELAHAVALVTTEAAGGDEYARPPTYREFLTGHRYSNADQDPDELAQLGAA